MPRNPKKPGAGGKKKSKPPSSAAAAMASAAAKKAAGAGGAPPPPTPQQPRVWLPGAADPEIDGDEAELELEYDPTAYDCLHRFQIEWPALSLDLPRDNMGAPRSAFPHELFVVAGTQADQPRNNCLALLRLTHLGQGRHGRREAGGKRGARRRDADEGEGDQKGKAAAAAGGGDDARMSEDDEDDDEDGDDAFEEDEDEDEDEQDDDGGDEPPRMHYRLIAQPHGTNRVRCAPQRPGLVAVWADTGSVRVLDVSAQLQEMAQDEHPKHKSASRVQVSCLFFWDCFSIFWVFFGAFFSSLEPPLRALSVSVLPPSWR
jgi:ribosome assembly protein RRB1